MSPRISTSGPGGNGFPTTSGSFAALTLAAAALIGGHEASHPTSTPDNGLCHGSLDPVKADASRNADRSEVERYLAEATSKPLDCATIRTLSQIGRCAIPTLERIALDRRASSTLRASSMQAIGEIGGSQAISSLTTILSEIPSKADSLPLFEAVINSIYLTGERAAVDVLAEIVHSSKYYGFAPEAHIKACAVYALGGLASHEAYEALWSIATNPNHCDRVRANAFIHLTRFLDRHPDSQERLLNLLENPGALSRVDLLAVTGLFGLTEFTPELIQIALNDALLDTQRVTALNSLRLLEASDACPLVAPLISAAKSEISDATIKLLVAVGDSSLFSEVIKYLRNNPDRFNSFRCRDYVDRVVRDPDFLAATHPRLALVLQHTLYECNRGKLSGSEAQDAASLLAVEISMVANRITTQPATLSPHIDSPLSPDEQELVKTLMKLAGESQTEIPVWAVPKLTLIAEKCPDLFLPSVKHTKLRDDLKSAISAAIARSGNKEAIERLNATLTGTPLQEIDRILREQVVPSTKIFAIAEDGSLSISWRLPSIRMIRHLKTSDFSSVRQLLESPVEAIRREMALQICAISDVNQISPELTACAAEQLLTLIERDYATFERIPSLAPSHKEMMAAAERLYEPRFCLGLLALANNESTGEVRNILGLLNKKVVDESGYLKFIDCLARASGDPHFSDKARALAKRYHDALTRARAIGVRSPFRFSIDLLERMLDDTQVTVGDTRPVVVICFAKGDNNQAGLFFRFQLSGMAQRGFRLLLMEPGNEMELEARSRELRAIMDASGVTGAEAIFPFGHGSKTDISLDFPVEHESETGIRPGVRDSGELYRIDLSDRGQLSSFGGLLKPGGLVPVLSCNTGQGGEGSVNLAQFLRHEVFSHACPEQIIAPKAPTSLSLVRIIYTSDGGMLVRFPVPESRH